MMLLAHLLSFLLKCVKPFCYALPPPFVIANVVSTLL